MTVAVGTTSNFIELQSFDNWGAHAVDFARRTTVMQPSHAAAIERIIEWSTSEDGLEWDVLERMDHVGWRIDELHE
jgi:hypothetical protein